MLTKKYTGICYANKSLSETPGDWKSSARKISGILNDNSFIRKMIPDIVIVNDRITKSLKGLFLVMNRII
ncbi:MAG TPA: hypothetical protein VKY57_15955 [Chitinispirillaceae bacterium]|nr:hypothetical protein [Chitinispirillaceae bacterium]